MIASQTFGESAGATWIMFNTPEGRPASMKSWVAKWWILGLYSDVFHTTALPAIMAFAKHRTPSVSGAFQAEIDTDWISVSLGHYCMKGGQVSLRAMPKTTP